MVSKEESAAAKLAAEAMRKAQEGQAEAARAAAEKAKLARHLLDGKHD